MNSQPPSLHYRLQYLFREVCNRPALEIHDNSTALSLPEWDSLAHVNLLLAVEQEFQVRFTLSEILEIDSVGALKLLLRAKGVNETPE
jgi:acyl carrier protein